MKKAYVVGTCDTKHPELVYVRDLLERAGVPAVLVDVGTRPHDNPVDVTAREVASFHPEDPGFLDRLDDRGEAVRAMAEALERFLPAQADLGGVLGLGGSGGTSLVTRGMRALPVGAPKVMVSTVASGDTAPYVGPNDICMMYSVTDVAGLNRISRAVLGNGAHALAGMLREEIPHAVEDRPLLGMTMFGVTTPCVDGLRRALEDRYEPLVFHATGTGGQSFEKLIASGLVRHVIDVTTTEIADLHMGGVMSAGEDRMESVIHARIPYVGSVGALDMVNFGGLPSVPEKYRNRKLHVHNPQVTLMRTTPEENDRMGAWIAAKLNRCEGPVRFLLPLGGVSLIDVPGMPFYDPEADRALFDALRRDVVQTPRRRLVEVEGAINDRVFVEALLEAFRETRE